jgi:hypothetical protein
MSNESSQQAYISTNPFAANNIENKGQSDARKEGKRRRILKPIYSVRLS